MIQWKAEKTEGERETPVPVVFEETMARVVGVEEPSVEW